MAKYDRAYVQYPKIDLQEIIYYAAPKQKVQLDSLNEVDPELLLTFEKLGISINEQKRLSGVAMDIVMDSVSVKTTFQETLKEKGIIWREKKAGAEEILFEYNRLRKIHGDDYE